MPSPRPTLKLAWRIGVNNYETDAAFERLLAVLCSHRTIVDEVCLFETVTHHLYIPPEPLAERIATIGRRLTSLREAGVPSVGVNVLTTIGHMNEAWDYMPPLPMAPMVGHDGSVSRGCACPNTPELREYIRAKYALVAVLRPDFIWVDDDIRMHHHGVTYGCFCETCLRLLAEWSGFEHSRESLVAALNEPGAGEVREAWVEQNVRSLELLMAHVAQAIHSVDPAIETGLMTAGPGWTTYSGQALDRWFTALEAVKSRPGGGFYNDDCPKQMIHKAFEVGRQRHGLPDTVTDRQYELENFPYHTLRKSSRSVTNECTLALASGMNGIAFNALGGGEGSLDDYLPLLARIGEHRHLWETLVSHAADLPTAGLWAAWHPRLMARRTVKPGEDWFAAGGSYNTTIPYMLAEIGLPMATDAPGEAVVLSGRVAEAFSDEELRQFLARGVLMDTASLEVLTERGLGGLTGVRIGRRVDNGVMERYTDDPLNGPHVGEVRDCRIEFWGDARGQADVLEPLAQGVRFLANLETYLNEQYGPCLSAYENDLGGRVVVMGYAPWMFIHSGAKRTQLQNLADWITRDRLPVRIRETVPLVPFVRLSEDRSKGLVVLLNAGFDPIESVTVEVRAPETPEVRALGPSGSRELRTARTDRGWSVVLIGIGPWTTEGLLWG
jgi:hypothetical protein